MEYWVNLQSIPHALLLLAIFRLHKGTKRVHYPPPGGVAGAPRLWNKGGPRP